MKSIFSVFAVLALMLALATAAYAGPEASSAIDGYVDQAGAVQNNVDSGTVSGVDDGGSLPFTGLDLALLAGAGGLLGAAGFGMRRLTRAPHSV